MNKEIQIDTEYITLGQFLKLAEIIDSGGMAKWFLSEHEVIVNGEQDQRRGRKLRIGDQIEIQNFGAFIIV
ncbi:S4 domain-containing protein YaaA [Robertmurraya yapensis]|uniref:S4 domain-containing protein YaaA n=1 Tax=Bacillus yapensis TaxID=2492960 RepID=A0A3S0KA23_9BACI|nr:S4 domain-containing protein YaaA [Bacillus yapensis]RTR26059.1 S4 domain-containing protein YaaA [Bacillus yapensis]TKS93571.1 S4 domain-containing protein YaaA [Bacillus yapensis]